MGDNNKSYMFADKDKIGTPDPYVPDPVVVSADDQGTAVFYKKPFPVPVHVSKREGLKVFDAGDVLLYATPGGFEMRPEHRTDPHRLWFSFRRNNWWRTCITPLEYLGDWLDPFRPVSEIFQRLSEFSRNQSADRRRVWYWYFNPKPLVVTKAIEPDFRSHPYQLICGPTGEMHYLYMSGVPKAAKAEKKTGKK